MFHVSIPMTVLGGLQLSLLPISESRKDVVSIPMTVLGGLQHVWNIKPSHLEAWVSIPMTVLGGLQPLTVLVGIFAVCRFNTDDGIRRATTDKTGPCQENDLSFQYR